VHNEATATALGPQNQPASGSDTNDATLPQPPPPAMALDISDLVGTHFVDANENGVADVGIDLIQFAIVLNNLSGDTLTDITASDLLGDAVAGNFQTPVPASLAPHGSANDAWQSTYNHILTAADVAAGHVYDELTVTALDSQGHTQTVMAEWDQFFPVI